MRNGNIFYAILKRAVFNFKRVLLAAKYMDSADIRDPCRFHDASSHYLP